MKRLWAFVSISIATIILLSIFSFPIKASASVGQSDYDALRSFSSEIDSTYRNVTTALPGLGEYSSRLSNKYLEFLDQGYASLKDNPDSTRSSLEVQALNSFIVYLKQEIADSGEPITIFGVAPNLVKERQLSATNAVLLVSTQKFNFAVSRNQLEKGTITAEQHAANLQNASKETSQGIAERSNKKCSLLGTSPIIDCIDEGFAWLIKNTLLQLGGFLVWLTANMLNFAIQISILDFSKWASSSLYPIWLVIRQIVSLFVVFAGLYLGFMYIIGRTETFGKFFGWLVIFALFVNFSYPFSRALVDVSNIISLNVYTAAVGTGPLTTDFSTAATTGGANTAGAQIMNRLGLYGLVGSATEVAQIQGANVEKGFVNQINSTPGALVAVVFVFYAAYIFFMATAIIAMRTAVLVFLTVASPLLLVDSVVPKLGDAAVKMRKMFFEQLAVAPVFMIMLALTLKFMEVFQTNGVLGKASMGAQLTGGADSIQTFFSIFMMLIMLHIMLKVTKSLAGEAGQAATNFMGKVGGFGLGVATGGAGILARGTIGAGAARLRDSEWMDKMKKSSVGRGMYGLTNSLAQSTYDVRNVGMVSGGLAKAGLTGGFGMTMQKGIKQGFDERKKSRTDEVVKFGSAIQDDETRSAYFSRVNTGRLVKVDATQTRQAERDVQEKRKAAILAYEKASPLEKQAILDKMGNDYALRDKLRLTDQYLAPNVKNGEREPDAMKKKVDALVKLNDSDIAKSVIDNDPFTEIHEAYKKELEEEEAALETADRKKEIYIAGADGKNSKTTEYEMKRKALAEKKANISKEIGDKRKELFDEYKKRIGGTPEPSVDFELPDDTSGGTRIDLKNPGGTDFSHLDNAGKPAMGPGVSDFSHLDQNEHPIPGIQRVEAQPTAPAPAIDRSHMDALEIRKDNERLRTKGERVAQSTVGSSASFDLHKDSFREAVARRTSSKALHELRTERQLGGSSSQGNPPEAAPSPTVAQPKTNPSPTGASVAA